jgi:hypothetical protein
MIGPNVKFQAGTLRRGLFARNATSSEGEIEHEPFLYLCPVTGKEAFVSDRMTLVGAEL